MRVHGSCLLSYKDELLKICLRRRTFPVKRQFQRRRYFSARVRVMSGRLRKDLTPHAPAGKRAWPENRCRPEGVLIAWFRVARLTK